MSLPSPSEAASSPLDNTEPIGTAAVNCPNKERIVIGSPLENAGPMDTSTGPADQKTVIGSPLDNTGPMSTATVSCSEKQRILIGSPLENVRPIGTAARNCADNQKAVTGSPLDNTGPMSVPAGDFPGNERILIGSHDHFAYCLNNTGKLLWKHKMDSPVYATPFVFSAAGSCNAFRTMNKEASATCWDLRHFAVVCSTAGKINMVDEETGKLLCTVTVPGEVFSSPVVCGNKLVMGCRDNHVYCFEMDFQSG